MDISNAAKDIKMDKDWAKRIMTEFFRQGNLPVLQVILHNQHV